MNYLLLFFKFIFLFFALSFQFKMNAFYEEPLTCDDLECCSCFIHCSCFGQCIGDFDTCFPQDTPYHPRHPIDRVWHEFLKGILTAKKTGPFFILERYQLWSYFDIGSNSDDIHSIPGFLEILERFRDRIAQARLDGIKLYKSLYSSPREKDKLDEELKLIEQKYKNANEILDKIPSKIIPHYQQAVMECIHATQFSVYNKGVMYSLLGQWDKALMEIQNFLELKKKNNITDLNSKFHQICGEAYLEINLFKEAIDALSIAIEKDPENKQAYFLRAAAYFENGCFDEALNDYLNSKNGNFIPKPSFASEEFTKALISATCKGSADGLVEFASSLCSTSYGLGKALWVTADHPIDSTWMFAGTCCEMAECIIDYCKTLDQNTFDECIDQIKILYERFDQMNEVEKGTLIGYAIGKYGVDILAGGAILKGLSKFQALKNANRICNMEAMLLSEANKKAIVASSLKHAAEREAYFKSARINWSRQNKHIPNKHNFVKGGGIIEIGESELEILLKNHVGTGQRVSGSLYEVGYRERVDFGKVIGKYAKQIEGQPTEYYPTSKGIVTYSKDGKMHVWPSSPNSVME